MLRHIVIAAFRNLAASKLISAIAVLGLGVGITAALLMALVVRSQFSFDHFIPAHERTFRLFFPWDTREVCTYAPGVTRATRIGCAVNTEIMPLLQQRFPQIEAIGALTSESAPVKIAQGRTIAWDRFAWASSDLFAALPLPALQGDLSTALARPDGLVLTQSMARKYFGADNVLGRSLTVNGRLYTVRAVLADYPRNATTLESGIFLSSLGTFNPCPAQDAGRCNRTPPKAGLVELLPRGHIYMRLRPGTTIDAGVATELMWSLPIMQRTLRENAGHGTPTDNRKLFILPMDRINVWEQFHPGIRLRLTAAMLAGGLVLLIAAINFVNLMVARAARREKEVGVRKVCGGGRGALMLHFLGEALVPVWLATLIGLVLIEWLLTPVNAFLRTGATLTWNDPVLLLGVPVFAGLLTLLIGAWPAFVLSALRPAGVLRGWAARSGQAGAIRGALVTLQFAILIVLAIGAAVIWLQRDFAARKALRVDSDQMLLVRLGATDGNIPDMMQAKACPPAFAEEVRKLPGVRGLACSMGGFLDSQVAGWNSQAGPFDYIGEYSVDPRLFALYGVRPLAGRLPGLSDLDGAVRATGVIVNLSAVRRLRFASPADAIGKNWISRAGMDAEFTAYYNKQYGTHAVITAVIPDVNFLSVNSAVEPTIYTPWNSVGARLFHIKLSGQEIPETLAAIDRIWAQSGLEGPLDRIFLDDYMQQLYQDMTRDAQFFAGCTFLAILLACMGLVGIAVATAERRVKEIGVRKAMGARSWQVAALLLWQFSLPVLLANLIAWPTAFWLMQRWLSGFAYRIELEWWMFAAASGAALVLAVLTVAGQTIQTARQKPVLALRYE